VRRLLTVLPLAGLLLAGCAAPQDPEVTFYSGGKTVHVGPTQYCDLSVENCQAHPEAAGALRVRPGRPLQISVPGQVADSPWTVLFTYRNAKGEPQPDTRTKIFPAGTQYAYTLVLPNPGDQLESVEVQVSGNRIEITDEGEIQFVTRGTWVLSIDDRA
jgi:hypothetical protein